LLLAAAIVAGCAAPVPPATPITIEQTREVIVTVLITPTRAPTPASTRTPSRADIKRAIQTAVDLYARAYNENNLDLLQQAVDQTNLPFRRLVQTRFQDFQKSFLRGKFRLSLTVTDVQPLQQGFALAHLQLRDGGDADWLFR
jgi:hypothetical protein